MVLENQRITESEQAEVYVYEMTLIIFSTVTLPATLLLGFAFHMVEVFT